MAILILIVVVMVVIGGLLSSKYGAIKTECEKYEFEHRGSGGMVSFKSFEESKNFEKRKRIAQARHSLGNFILIVAVVIVMGTFIFANR